jgi:hypothetical protein
MLRMTTKGFPHIKAACPMAAPSISNTAGIGALDNLLFELLILHKDISWSQSGRHGS